MIILIGSEGSMGKRYQAILKDLGQKLMCFDVGADMDALVELCKVATHAIIASPTDTHIDYISLLADNKVPSILCEKPICKDIDALRSVWGKVVQSGSRLTMMLQYWMLVSDKTVGESYYNYFKHGSDGIAWDCMQILGLARGHVWLSEESPIWKCMINGKILHISDMDRAYIRFVVGWLDGKIIQDPKTIIDMHLKAYNFSEDENEANKGFSRHPGKVYERPLPRQNPGKNRI